MRRHQNRWLHTWGVTNGLDVQTAAAGKVMVSAGSGLDGQGREILLPREENLNLGSIRPDEDHYLVVSYEEGSEPEDRVLSSGQEEFVRTAIRPAPGFGRELTAERRLGSSTGQTSRRRKWACYRGLLDPDDGERAHSSSWHRDRGTGRQIGHTGEAGTRSCRSVLGAGVQQLIFKPHDLPGEPGFSCGATRSFCGVQGAKGTMTIPVPPSATRIKKIRVTGNNIAGTIEFTVIRASWNSVRLDVEHETLLTQRLEYPKAFDREWEIETRLQALDLQNAAVARVFLAVKDTVIFFVAAEFA